MRDPRIKKLAQDLGAPTALQGKARDDLLDTTTGGPGGRGVPGGRPADDPVCTTPAMSSVSAADGHTGEQPISRGKRISLMAQRACHRRQGWVERLEAAEAGKPAPGWTTALLAGRSANKTRWGGAALSLPRHGPDGQDEHLRPRGLLLEVLPSGLVPGGQGPGRARKG